MTGLIRQIRGAVGNALVWGAAWAGLGATAAFLITGSVLGAMILGVKFGIFGVLTGAVFSSILPIVYRGRGISSLRPVRFGIVGGIVAGVFVPLFMQAMNALTGGAIPWRLVLDDAPIVAVFGGLAAGGSLWLAQRAQALPTPHPTEQLGSGVGADGFATAARERVAR
jgi:hypothetical protein